MRDLPSETLSMHSYYGAGYRHAALIMTGFDSVTVGNDEYILLTPPDHGTGEIREFLQLPNDPKTVSELMDLIGGGGGWDEWRPLGRVDADMP